MFFVRSKVFSHLLKRVFYLVFGVSMALQAEDNILIYTEDYHPYSYLDQKGKVVGVSTEIVRRIMDETGLSYEVRLVPWSRAYREAMGNERAFIFSLARLKEREADFDWLAYLVKPEFHVFVKQDEMRPVTLKSLRSGEFTAVCVVEDISCVLLRELGFPEDRFLKKRDGGLSASDMIAYGRADLYVGDILHHRVNPSENKRKVKPVMRVGEGVGLYLAAGYHVDQKLRDRVRQASERLNALKGSVSKKPR